MNTSQLSKSIGGKLRAQGLTLSVAESCTGGLVGHLLTQVSGSSDYFVGGMIAYSNQIKQRQLKVAQLILKQYGAVSIQTAAAMARGGRKVFKTDFCLSLTGIAGPTGGSAGKPVGLVCVGLADTQRALTFKKIFRGSRSKIKQQAAHWALTKLHGFI